VVGDLLAIFAERWNDPNPLDRRTPYRMLLQRLAHMPRHPQPLPEAAPPPPPAGPHAVQLLRTYGVKRPPFPFAPVGERSVARAYAKAFARARSLIYIEDQYLWSTEVAAALAEANFGTPPPMPSTDGTQQVAARRAAPDACATTLPNPSRPSSDSGRSRSAASSWTQTAAPAGCEALLSFRPTLAITKIAAVPRGRTG
jgi:hypothetical protein